MDCPVCESAAEELPRTGGATKILCRTCGLYKISDNVDIATLSELAPEQRRALLDKSKESAQARPDNEPTITSYLLEKRRFVGATRAEASRHADEWFAANKSYRQIDRKWMSTSSRGPGLADADEWTVTVYYGTT